MSKRRRNPEPINAIQPFSTLPLLVTGNEEIPSILEQIQGDIKQLNDKTAENAGNLIAIRNNSQTIMNSNNAIEGKTATSQKQDEIKEILTNIFDYFQHYKQIITAFVFTGTPTQQSTNPRITVRYSDFQINTNDNDITPPSFECHLKQVQIQQITISANESTGSLQSFFFLISNKEGGNVTCPGYTNMAHRCSVASNANITTPNNLDSSTYSSLYIADQYERIIDRLILKPNTIRVYVTPPGIGRLRWGNVIHS